MNQPLPPSANRITGQFHEAVLFLAITFGLAFSAASQTTEPFEVRRAEAAFEELPVLNANEILRPEFLAGPHHKVREPVPTYFGANQFTIDSEFGVFEAHGNEMLIRRIKEINAIAQLKDVSRTDEYKNALVAAAKSPVAAAKNIVMIRSTLCECAERHHEIHESRRRKRQEHRQESESNPPREARCSS
jgi:hypothetical protein